MSYRSPLQPMHRFFKGAGRVLMVGVAGCFAVMMAGQIIIELLIAGFARILGLGGDDDGEPLPDFSRAERIPEDMRE